MAMSAIKEILRPRRPVGAVESHVRAKRPPAKPTKKIIPKKKRPRVLVGKARGGGEEL